MWPPGRRQRCLAPASRSELAVTALGPRDLRRAADVERRSLVVVPGGDVQDSAVPRARSPAGGLGDQRERRGLVEEPDPAVRSPPVARIEIEAPLQENTVEVRDEG